MNKAKECKSRIPAAGANPSSLPTSSSSEISTSLSAPPVALEM